MPTINRFDPTYWTVIDNWPNSSCAINAHDDLVLSYKGTDTVLLKWYSYDTYGHNQLCYETNYDYTGVIWEFDCSQAFTLLCEDTAGNVVSSPYDAGTVHVEFNSTQLISVALSFSIAGEGEIVISNQVVNSVLKLLEGESGYPVGTALKYETSRHLTPQRAVGQALGLGYRHHLSLILGHMWLDTGISPIASGWINEFMRQCFVSGIQPIPEFGFEWPASMVTSQTSGCVQRDYYGNMAVTEYGAIPLVPSQVTGWVNDTAQTLLAMCEVRGCTPKVRVAQPAWWAGGLTGASPFFYDAYTTSLTTIPFFENIFEETQEFDTLDFMRAQLDAAMEAIKAPNVGIRLQGSLYSRLDMGFLRRVNWVDNRTGFDHAVYDGLDLVAEGMITEFQALLSLAESEYENYTVSLPVSIGLRFDDIHTVSNHYIASGTAFSADFTGIINTSYTPGRNSLNLTSGTCTYTRTTNSLSLSTSGTQHGYGSLVFYDFGIQATDLLKSLFSANADIEITCLEDTIISNWLPAYSIQRSGRIMDVLGPSDEAPVLVSDPTLARRWTSRMYADVTKLEALYERANDMELTLNRKKLSIEAKTIDLDVKIKEVENLYNNLESSPSTQLDLYSSSTPFGYYPAPVYDADLREIGSPILSKRSAALSAGKTLAEVTVLEHMGSYRADLKDCLDADPNTTSSLIFNTDYPIYADGVSWIPSGYMGGHLCRLRLEFENRALMNELLLQSSGEFPFDLLEISLEESEPYREGINSTESGSIRNGLLKDVSPFQWTLSGCAQLNSSVYPDSYAITMPNGAYMEQTDVVLSGNYIYEYEIEYTCSGEARLAVRCGNESSILLDESGGRFYPSGTSNFRISNCGTNPVTITRIQLVPKLLRIPSFATIDTSLRSLFDQKLVKAVELTLGQRHSSQTDTGISYQYVISRLDPRFVEYSEECRALTPKMDSSLKRIALPQDLNSLEVYAFLDKGQDFSKPWSVQTLNNSARETVVRNGTPLRISVTGDMHLRARIPVGTSQTYADTLTNVFSAKWPDDIKTTSYEEKKNRIENELMRALSNEGGEHTWKLPWSGSFHNSYTHDLAEDSRALLAIANARCSEYASSEYSNWMPVEVSGAWDYVPTAIETGTYPTGITTYSGYSGVICSSQWVEVRPGVAIAWVMPIEGTSPSDTAFWGLITVHRGRSYGNKFLVGCRIEDMTHWIEVVLEACRPVYTYDLTAIPATPAPVVVSPYDLEPPMYRKLIPGKDMNIWSTAEYYNNMLRSMDNALYVGEQTTFKTVPPALPDIFRKYAIQDGVISGDMYISPDLMEDTFTDTTIAGTVSLSSPAYTNMRQIRALNEYYLTTGDKYDPNRKELICDYAPIEVFITLEDDTQFRPDTKGIPRIGTAVAVSGAALYLLSPEDKAEYSTDPQLVAKFQSSKIVYRLPAYPAYSNAMSIVCKSRSGNTTLATTDYIVDINTGLVFITSPLPEDAFLVVSYTAVTTAKNVDMLTGFNTTQYTTRNKTDYLKGVKPVLKKYNPLLATSSDYYPVIDYYVYKNKVIFNEQLRKIFDPLKLKLSIKYTTVAGNLRFATRMLNSDTVPNMLLEVEYENNN